MPPARVGEHTNSLQHTCVATVSIELPGSSADSGNRCLPAWGCLLAARGARIPTGYWPGSRPGARSVAGRRSGLHQPLKHSRGAVSPKRPLSGLRQRALSVHRNLLRSGGLKPQQASALDVAPPPIPSPMPAAAAMDGVKSLDLRVHGWPRWSKVLV